MFSWRWIVQKTNILILINVSNYQFELNISDKMDVERINLVLIVKSLWKIRILKVVMNGSTQPKNSEVSNKRQKPIKNISLFVANFTF